LNSRSMSIVQREASHKTGRIKLGLIWGGRSEFEKQGIRGRDPEEGVTCSGERGRPMSSWRREKDGLSGNEPRQYRRMAYAQTGDLHEDVQCCRLVRHVGSRPSPATPRAPRARASSSTTISPSLWMCLCAGDVHQWGRKSRSWAGDDVASSQQSALSVLYLTLPTAPVRLECGD